MGLLPSPIANTVRVFSLQSTQEYANQICSQLGIPLSPMVEKTHPDGEIYVQSKVNVRQKTVLIVSSLFSDEVESVNDKLAKFKYFCASLKDAAASKVFGVIPYFPYARSDRKTKPREPVIMKYLGLELTALGLDHLIVADIHNLQSFQCSYDLLQTHTDNIPLQNIFSSWFAKELKDISPHDISILSPDTGGFARSDWFRSALISELGPGIGLAFIDKSHVGDGYDKSANNIVGQIKPVMIGLDDMIDGASTMALAAKMVSNNGCERFYAVASHFLGTRQASEKLADSSIYKIVISDTLPPFRLSPEVLDKVSVVSSVEYFSQAIARTLTGESLSELFM